LLTQPIHHKANKIVLKLNIVLRFTVHSQTVIKHRWLNSAARYLVRFPEYYLTGNHHILPPMISQQRYKKIWNYQTLLCFSFREYAFFDLWTLCVAVQPLPSTKDSSLDTFRFILIIWSSDILYCFAIVVLFDDVNIRQYY